jgi:hypothetical protein
MDTKKLILPGLTIVCSTVIYLIKDMSADASAILAIMTFVIFILACVFSGSDGKIG